MTAKTKDARVKLAQNKKLRRRWLTWLRMARYGANNFTRNAWLTTAATAVMTITLLIIFTTFVARNVLTATVANLRSDLDIPVYLQGDTTSQEVSALTAKLRTVANVENVEFESSEQARRDFVNAQVEGDDQETLLTLSELESSEAFPATLRIFVTDPNDVDDIETLVTQDEQFQENLSTSIPTNFRGERLGAINTISGWASTAEKVGIVATIIFVAISMLIVFNTIRMAIFNRKEEIQMMKLIGADKSFIRGPFVVEAVMYGFIAALFATGLGFFGLLALEPRLAAAGVSIASIKNDLVYYAPIVLICMIIVGAIIGVISSRLAVRRYLKV